MTSPTTPVRTPRPGAAVQLGSLVIGLGLLAILVRLAARPLGNNDTYFHLRFGREFLDSWSLGQPGSVTRFATADWIPTQWLPEIVMRWFESQWGLAGVAWLFGLLLVALATTLYVVARGAADPLPSAVLCLVTLIASGTALSMRPQMLSLIFLAASVGVWQSAIRRQRTPWELVPLTWLWAACHGMWPFAVLLGVVTVIGLALDGRPRREVARLAVVPLSSAVAVMLTPVGPRIFSAIASVNARRDYFAEWSPPDLRDPRTMLAAAMLTVAVVARLRAPRGTAWVTVGWLAFAGGACTYSIRTVPLAAIIVLPLVADTLQLGMGRVLWRLRRREIALALAFALAAVAVLAALVPRTSSEPSPSPPWLDEALDDLPPGTAVLNEWNFGGYLIWRHRQLEFVMHGYGDAFTDAELERNKDILDVAPGWDRLVADTGSTYAVLNPDNPLAYALARLPTWRVVRKDPDVVLLERNGPRADVAGGEDPG